MLNTILIDDEILAIERLKRLLKQFGDQIKIIAEFTNPEEAITKIDELKPDLIFLDIQMPGYNGFELLEKITHQPLIIFITAYDQYALKAFETNSIDYLLKPVDKKRLAQSIEKLLKITSANKIDYEKRINELIRFIKQSTSKKIQVKIGNEIRLIDTNEIYFLRALDKYVEIYTHEKKYLSSLSLNKFEEMIDENEFVRVHRSVIINLKHLDTINRSINGYKVRMKDKNNSVLPVSRYLKHNLGI